MFVAKAEHNHTGLFALKHPEAIAPLNLGDVLQRDRLDEINLAR